MVVTEVLAAMVVMKVLSTVLDAEVFPTMAMMEFWL